MQGCLSPNIRVMCHCYMTHIKVSKRTGLTPQITIVSLSWTQIIFLYYNLYNSLLYLYILNHIHQHIIFIFYFITYYITYIIYKLQQIQ